MFHLKEDVSSLAFPLKMNLIFGIFSPISTYILDTEGTETAGNQFLNFLSHFSYSYSLPHAAQDCRIRTVYAAPYLMNNNTNLCHNKDPMYYTVLNGDEHTVAVNRTA